MRRARSLFLLLLPILLLSCDRDELTAPPEPQALEGSWVGTIRPGLQTSSSFQPRLSMDGNAPFDEVELVVVQDGNRIEGIGSFRTRPISVGTGIAVAAERTLAFEVAGLNSYPTVALALRSGSATAPGTDLTYLRGEFRGTDLVVGTLQGGGFTDEQVRLRRQLQPLR